ncbi:hypothetical protein PAPYR_13518 [Paratrimastix pyriformis]|uniref:Uncharacterized protein n=1 Tax=Paratrimastix pyriformis TaxID=342808 RepID=A0ABQ8U516_9EUKA|nr:hypothetical protein PAPYR_13518 [Paratrimastix pyriformis]
MSAHEEFRHNLLRTHKAASAQATAKAAILAAQAAAQQHLNVLGGVRETQTHVPTAEEIQAKCELQERMMHRQLLDEEERYNRLVMLLNQEELGMRCS